MKFLHEVEDCIVGIVVGAIMLAPTITQVPYSAFVFPAAFAVFLAFNVFDVFQCAKDFKGDEMMCSLSIMSNIVDIFINMAFLSRLLKLEIPIVSSYLEPLITPTTTLVIGAYFVVFNLWWIMASRKK